jgi:hypothetical protein
MKNNDGAGLAFLLALALSATDASVNNLELDGGRKYRERALPDARARELIGCGWKGSQACAFAGSLAMTAILHELIPLALHQAGRHKSAAAIALLYAAHDVLSETVSENERALKSGFDSGYELPSRMALVGLYSKLETYGADPRVEARQLRAALEQERLAAQANLVELKERRDESGKDGALIAELRTQRADAISIAEERMQRIQAIESDRDDTRAAFEGLQGVHELTLQELAAANSTIAAMQRQAVEKLEHIVIRDDSQARVLSLVGAELSRATAKFPRFNSLHEGWAVIQEEVDELWDEAKGHSTERVAAAVREAIQISAMGARFVVDICAKYRGTAELPQVDDLALVIDDIRTEHGRVGDMPGARLDASVGG